MHQRIQPKKPVNDLLFGANAVLSALQAKKRKFFKAYFPMDITEISKRQAPARDELQQIKHILHDRKIPIKYKYKYELNKLAENRPHNGVLLEASSLKFTNITSLGTVEAKHYHIHTSSGEKLSIPRCVNGHLPPLFVYLDGLWDPHNVGAVLRTCLYMGVAGILVPRHAAACPFTASVAKSSAGALDWLDIYAIPRVVPFLQTSLAHGWALRITAPPPGSGAADLPMAAPSILVVGNEHHGITSALLPFVHTRDWVATRLGHGHPWADSLNVSVATGMVLAKLLHGPLPPPPRTP